MKYMQKVKNKKLTLFIAILAIFGFSSIAPTSITGVSADENNMRSYMQIYSENGTYSAVKIQLVNVSDDAHYCGGTMKSSGSAPYTVIKHLSKSAPTRFRCSAVDGGATSGHYVVTFLKGKAKASNGSTVPYETYKYSLVNVDNGFCTVLTPRGGGNPNTNPSYKNRCPPRTADSVALHSATVKMCVTNPMNSNSCDTNATGISYRHGASGRISLYEDAPLDGSNNMSRYFCTGNLNYQYRNNATGAMSIIFATKLRFASGSGAFADHCTARIGRDAAKFTSGSSYSVLASYSGNGYLSPANSSNPGTVTANFQVK